jgi:2-desacetyl-2-hydroxyethyl bacteriochlorophyllide A dehydrogenase
MRAARLHEMGGGLVLRVDDDVPVPKPDVDEVLVRVRACGLNRVDLLTRDAETPQAVPLPHISGTEVAGEVVQLGEGVTGWQEGARVLVNPVISCGDCEFCIEGHDNLCRRGQIYGVQTPGGYADYAVVPSRQLVAIPDTLSFEQAAAIAVTGPTAYHMLVTRARVRAGEDVLIVAGGSGIGVLGIQLAKLAGARVAATAGDAQKMAQARELGADLVVNHRIDGWADEVRAWTGNRGVDLVFEHVGEATWEQSLRALARRGRLVTCGGHSGFDVGINLWHLFVKEQQLIGSFAGNRSDLAAVLRLAERGDLSPVIHQTFPLSEAIEAQQVLEDRQAFGKVLLVPGAD